MYIIFSHRFYLPYANQKTIDIGINTDFAFFFFKSTYGGLRGEARHYFFVTIFLKSSPDSVGLMTRWFNRLHFLFPITPASPVNASSSTNFPPKVRNGLLS